MQVNLKKPFILHRQARTPHCPSLSAPLHKRIKKETEQLLVKPAKATIQGTKVSIPNFSPNPLNPGFNPAPKQMLIPEETETYFSPFSIEANYNWPLLRCCPIANQSFDTQSSLSQSEEKPKQKQNQPESSNFYTASNERLFESWNEGLSLIESEEQNSLDFALLEGIGAKETRKFPVPFGKEIINYLDEDF